MNTSKIPVMIGVCMLLTGLVSCEKKQTKEEDETEKLRITAELISNPVSEISCADPSIVKHDGKYYIYATIDRRRRAHGIRIQGFSFNAIKPLKN